MMKNTASPQRILNEGQFGLICWVLVLSSCSGVRGAEDFEAQVEVNPGSGMIEVTWPTVAGFLYRFEGSSDFEEWSEETTLYGLGQTIAVAVAPAPDPVEPQGGGGPPPPVSDRYESVSFVFRSFANNERVLASWHGSNGPVSVVLPRDWTNLGSIPAFSESYPLEEETEDPANPGQFLTDNVLYSISCSLAQVPGVTPSVPVFVDGAFIPDVLSEEDEAYFGVLWKLIGATDFETALADAGQGLGNGPGTQQVGGTGGFGSGARHFRVVRIEVDSDQDGLADHLELLLYGTSPFLRDSDGDGLDDGVEITGDTDPNDPDSDGDGTPDGLDEASNNLPAWHLVTRNLQYYYAETTSDGETEGAGTLTLAKSWPQATDSQTSVSTHLPPSAQLASLDSFAPFPQTPPGTGLAALPAEGGFAAGSRFTGTFNSNGEGSSKTYDCVADQVSAWLVISKPRAYPVTLTYLDVTRVTVNGGDPVESATVITVTIPAGETHSQPVLLDPAVPNVTDTSNGTHETAIERTLAYLNFGVDANRDRRVDLLDEIPTFPGVPKESTAYAPGLDGAFRQFGAIAWTNLDEDEQRLRDPEGTATPISDTIRFWHDGIRFEATDEDWTLREGERPFSDQLPGYVTPAGGTRSPLPDVFPLLVSRVEAMPKTFKVFLRLPEARLLRAFHLFSSIPDFKVGGDVDEEVAIWGAFGTEPAPAPWLGQDHVIDDTMIEITKWVNPNAPGYLGAPAPGSGASGSTPIANSPSSYLFGLEAMLYKGMRYDFTDGAAGGEFFDGNLPLELVVKDGASAEIFTDPVHLTLLRLPAFPGAEGFGHWASGGRGGEVFVVDSLDDPMDYQDTPTLRSAVKQRKKIKDKNGNNTEQNLPRTVVFRVPNGDAIVLHDTLDIKRGNLTIAGQRAPFRGITLDGHNLPGNEYNATGQTQVSVPAVVIGNNSLGGTTSPRASNDVVLRYIRSRRAADGNPVQGELPDDTEAQQDGDALVIKSASDVIVDHCSFSWGDDGILDLVQFRDAANQQPEMDATVQWSFLYQGLRKHSKAMLIAGKFGARYSVHHNLFGHSAQRHPEINEIGDAVRPITGTDTDPFVRGTFLEFSYNMVWNWGDEYAGYAGGGLRGEDYLRYQFRGNLYDQGPSLPGNVEPMAFHTGDREVDIIYFYGNHWDGDREPQNDEYTHVDGDERERRADAFATETKRDDASAAYDAIKAHGGCSLPEWDETDRLFRAERADVDGGNLSSHFEIIEHVSENDSFATTPFAPESGGVAAPDDTDDDGMGDAWENAMAPPGEDYLSVQPWDDPDGDGWTNLEEYLNFTDPNLGNDPLSREFHVPPSP